MSHKSSSDGIHGSYNQVRDNVINQSKYSNVSVIDAFRQLDNTEPVMYRVTIQPASDEFSNFYANVVLDTKVSDSFVFNYSVNTLICCETLQEQLGQSHCCAYLQLIELTSFVLKLLGIQYKVYICIQHWVIMCRDFMRGISVTVTFLGCITYLQVR